MGLGWCDAIASRIQSSSHKNREKTRLIQLHRNAAKEFEKLSPNIRSRIVCALKKFHETSRGDIRQIRGELWALAVGDYRVYYWKRAGDIGVVGVDHRSQAYIPERVESLEKRLAG